MTSSLPHTIDKHNGGTFLCSFTASLANWISTLMFDSGNATMFPEEEAIAVNSRWLLVQDSRTLVHKSCRRLSYEPVSQFSPLHICAKSGILRLGLSLK